MKSLTVVKFGGSLTKNPKAQSKFLKELAEISRRQNIILVHLVNSIAVEQKHIGYFPMIN